MADITVADLDRLDALHAGVLPGDRVAVASGAIWRTHDNGVLHNCTVMNGDPDENALHAALHNAWPSVSAQLRRALAVPTCPCGDVDCKGDVDDAEPPGLVFGPREKYGGRRTATASDGATYTTTPEYSGRGGPLEREEGVALRCPDEAWSTSYRTEEAAIAAANAHNAARLARKGSR